MFLKKGTSARALARIIGTKLTKILELLKSPRSILPIGLICHTNGNKRMVNGNIYSDEEPLSRCFSAN